MTICTSAVLEFPAVKRRRVQAAFDGGPITSDGGALLLGYADQNDHQTLRHDAALQSALVCDAPLAGQATLSRLEYARGEMENRIKEQQLDLFADRTSCHDWWANRWRLLLSTVTYALHEGLRRVGLAGTDLARACCGTIRLRLLKIGAVVLRTTRRVRPHQNARPRHLALATTPLTAARA